MNRQDFSWKTFTNTGAVDAYLLYKSVKSDDVKEGTDGKHQDQGYSNKANQLW